jgi:hypothetical protein
LVTAVSVLLLQEVKAKRAIRRVAKAAVIFFMSVVLVVIVSLTGQRWLGTLKPDLRPG